MSVEIHSLPSKATRFLVDGQPVNPWLVGIDLSAQTSPFRSVELDLDLEILIFEMKQYGVMLTKESVRQFVSDDIKDHREKALDVYLSAVRCILNPPPRRKNFGWFARMLTSPPKWTPPAPNWKWTRVTEISLSDQDALVIKGECCEIAGPTQTIPT